MIEGFDNMTGRGKPSRNRVEQFVREYKEGSREPVGGSTMLRGQIMIMAGEAEKNMNVLMESESRLRILADRIFGPTPEKESGDCGSEAGSDLGQLSDQIDKTGALAHRLHYLIERLEAL